VLKYLARYTHRIAIANGRLVRLADHEVTFQWRDSADGNTQKLMTVTAVEFIRRFLMHVLPGWLREDPSFRVSSQLQSSSGISPLPTKTERYQAISVGQSACRTCRLVHIRG